MTGDMRFLKQLVDDFEGGRFREVPDGMLADLDEAIRTQADIQNQPYHVWARKLAADLAAAPSDTRREREHGE